MEVEGDMEPGAEQVTAAAVLVTASEKDSDVSDGNKSDDVV